MKNLVMGMPNWDGSHCRIVGSQKQTRAMTEVVEYVDLGRRCVNCAVQIEAVSIVALNLGRLDDASSLEEDLFPALDFACHALPVQYEVSMLYKLQATTSRVRL